MVNQDAQIQRGIETYLDTLRFLNESTDDYLYLWDFRTGKLYFVGEVYKKYCIQEKGETSCTVSDWAKIVYERDLPRVKEDLGRVERGETQIHNMQYRLIDREGNKVWVNCRGKSQLDRNGCPKLMIGRVSETALGRLADPVTGLLNVIKMKEDLAESLSEEKNGYLLILGIDNFKNINIKNGRDFGNQILKMIADILEETVDTSHCIYRLDGDRFAVHMEGVEKQSVEFVYKRVQDKTQAYCTLSAGAVSCMENVAKNSGVLYQYAEIAMDNAKRLGKNTLVFFAAEEYRTRLDRIELQEEIRQSIQDDFRGFYLCYQPQLDSQSYCISGAEALLRFRSSSRGDLSPVEFIPILEQTEWICSVGMWALKMALEQCREWRKYLPNFHISVNISYVQLQKENISKKVLEVLRACQLPGEALTLEVTESMQLQDYQYFNKIFYQWKKSGIRIAVDDFGTGYSSLGHLKSMEIDEVKIDRCFVKGIQNNAYNYRLLYNMMELAHSAEISVCCEGVETEEELRVLRELQPDLLQGFLFARPYERKVFEEVYIMSESTAYQKRLERERYFYGFDTQTKDENPQTTEKEELGAILENLEEMVYIRDVDTYELYYLNAAGRRLTGVYDYKGRKCYEVLQDGSEPCALCSNKYLDGEESRLWKMESPFLNCHLILKDRLVTWQGKTVHMGIAIDVTENETGDENRGECLTVGQSTAEWKGAQADRMKSGEPVQCANESLDCRWQDILGATNVGLWSIRMDREKGYYEMFSDYNMRRIMGIEEEITPQQCYYHWYDRVNDGYYHYVNLAVDSMIQSRRIVQLEYTWNHPTEGDMIVRCLGIRVEDVDGMICLEGYHHIISDMDKPKFLPDTVASEIFEYNELKKTIYFHTGRELLAGDAVREYHFPECWLESEMVHPHFAEKFCAVFQAVEKREETEGLEVLLKTKKGGYEWFRIKTRHLGLGKEDKNTIIVLLDPANQERALELAYMRVQDFYEAILSETIAYAEVDVESGQLTRSGGLWREYQEECRQYGESFHKIIQRHLDVVMPEEAETYSYFFSQEMVRSMYAEGKYTKKVCIRRFIGGELRWVEMVVHVFQERFSENMYELLYLKDIDVEKKRELAQEVAASRDPLTDIYNRRFFEQEVKSYMMGEEGGQIGAMVLIDLDDFKDINDRYGHLEGDAALKRLARVLMSTFRSRDVVARMGGDEFMVFIKGVNRIEVLDKRMREMYDALQSTKELLFTCSVGIAVADNCTFSYEECLRQADEALYKSKKRGKNTWSYYGEGM